MSRVNTIVTVLAVIISVILFVFSKDDISKLFSVFDFSYYPLKDVAVIILLFHLWYLIRVCHKTENANSIIEGSINAMVLDSIASAKSEICVIAFSYATLLDSTRKAIIELLKNGGSISIILLNPDSPGFKYKVRFEELILPLDTRENFHADSIKKTIGWMA